MLSKKWQKQNPYTPHGTAEFRSKQLNMDFTEECNHMYPKFIRNDDGDNLVDDKSPLISESSIQTESMGRDAIEECAGVMSPTPAERGEQGVLFMEEQGKLRGTLEFSDPSSTEEWINQAVSAITMVPCKY